MLDRSRKVRSIQAALRVEVNPPIMIGMPIVRGTRILVAILIEGPSDLTKELSWRQEAWQSVRTSPKQT